MQQKDKNNSTIEEKNISQQPTSNVLQENCDNEKINKAIGEIQLVLDGLTYKQASIALDLAKQSLLDKTIVHTSL